MTLARAFIAHVRLLIISLTLRRRTRRYLQHIGLCGKADRALRIAFQDLIVATERLLLAELALELRRFESDSSGSDGGGVGVAIRLVVMLVLWNGLCRANEGETAGSVSASQHAGGSQTKVRSNILQSRSVCTT